MGPAAGLPRRVRRPPGPRAALHDDGQTPYGWSRIQLLDGIGAGIFGVVGTLVIADLTRGTGRFNLMQGALATATGEVDP